MALATLKEDKHKSISHGETFHADLTKADRTMPESTKEP